MCRHSQAVLTALLLLVPGASLAQSVNMGTTFHGLEARARRVVATFPEGVVDVRRREGQAIEAVFRTHEGRDEGGLTIPSGSRRVQWRQAGGGTVSEFLLPDQATVSLDWAAHQLHALHEDARVARAEGRALQVEGDEGMWDGHVRRSRVALGRGVSSGQLASRVEEIETTFDDIIVRARLDRHDRRQAGRSRIDYSRFTAAIRDARTGAARGFVRWFDTAQVLTWKIEGGSQGVVLAERLRGGWTFTPTMGWANVQAYQFVTQAASTLEAGPPVGAGLAAGRRETGPEPFTLVARAMAPLPSLAAGLTAPRVRDVVSDVLGDLTSGWWAAAGGLGGGAMRNEPGCDNLHWLDGSIFRACCDVHDKCYETNGCSSSSWWWPFSGTWSCQRCNAQVVYCFCTLSNPAYCGGGGGGSGSSEGGSGCTSVAGGFCPVECQSCQAH